MNIRFTATSDDYETRIFRTEDDFIEYLDTLWQRHGGYPSSVRNAPRIQARVLADPEPRSYPCIMLIAGQHERYNGQDELHNIFLYDVEILEDSDADEEAAWQASLAA